MNTTIHILEQLTRVVMILSMWEDLRESPPDTHNALTEMEYDDRVQKQCGKDSDYAIATPEEYC